MSLHVDLVVPAYNEVGNLEHMVERTTSVLRAQADDFTFGIILVVSDGSTDGTQKLAAELDDRYPEVSRLVRTENFGFGNAIRDGLTYADGDVIIPFMADLSDDPADIPQMVAKINEGYDIVYGSRFMEGGSVDGYPPLKLLYNRSFNNLIRFLFGIGEKDVTNAFTAYRGEVIDEIGMDTLYSEGFDITAELPLRATVKGFRITEIPVSWKSREAGVSKLNATRKGPIYFKRVMVEFVRGNSAGLRDLFASVTDQGVARALGATLFGVLLLVGLFTFSGFTDVFSAISNTNPLFVAGIVVVYPVSFILRTWRWRVLLRASGHLAGRANTFRCIMAGWLLNSLLPARAGDVMRGYALKTTEGTPFSVGIGTIVIERVLDMLVLGAMMAVVAGFYVREARTTYLAIGAFLIGVVLLTGLVAVYLIGHRVSDLLEDRIEGVSKSIRTVQRALRRVSGNPFAVALSAAISLPVWLTEIATIYLAARAVGVNLGVVPTVTAGISAFVSQAVPVTPGGLGTYEAAITSILVLFGIDSSTATALALVDHFTRLGVIYVIGSIAAIHLIFQSRPYFREQEQAVGEGVANESGQLSSTFETDGDRR